MLPVNGFLSAAEAKDVIQSKKYFKDSRDLWDHLLDGVTNHEFTLCALGGLIDYLSRLMVCLSSISWSIAIIFVFFFSALLMLPLYSWMMFYAMVMCYLTKYIGVVSEWMDRHLLILRFFITVLMVVQQVIPENPSLHERSAILWCFIDL